MPENYRQVRKTKLQKEFDETISPCNDCELGIICKHYRSLNKFDFNPEVFEVYVDCKIKNQYTLKKKD